MRTLPATVWALVVSNAAFGSTGCRGRASERRRPPDAGALVTVYLAPGLPEQMMGRLQTLAARHQWALSIRTDSGAATEADLAISERGGRVIAQVRPGSVVAVQAGQLAAGVMP